MRIAPMRSARTGIALLATAALLALPGGALAQANGEPEMMEDPVEAMEPEIEVGDPVAPVEPVAPVAPADDEVIAQNGAPEANGFADGAVDERAAEAGPAIAAPSVTSGSGQLPFTGTASGRLVQLFLVGSVLLAGGVVSLAWASARREHA